MSQEDQYIGVVMPVYNALPFLEEALASLLADLPANGTLVVVDDSSTDGSWEHVRRKAGGDKRIRLIRNEVNQGISGALNVGMRQLVNCKYIAVAEHDDITVLGRLKAEADFLDNNPAYGAVSTEGKYVGPTGRVFGRVAVGPSSREELDRLKGEGKPVLIPHPAVMYRTSALRWPSPYDADFDGAQDLELINRMVYSDGWLVSTLPKVGIHYRLHPQATSSTGLRNQRAISRYLAFRNSETLAGNSSVPTLTQWLEHHSPSRRQAIRWYRHDLGAAYYRRAGLAWLSGHYVTFALFMLASAATHPKWVLLKLRVLTGG